MRPYDETDSALRKTIDRFDPLIASYHSVLKSTDSKNLQSANQVLVNSQFVQNSVNKIYNRDPVVCYLGIDIDWFKPTQEEKKNFVLSVGSLTPLKGFDFLIEALSKIPQEIRPQLIIASNFQNPPEKHYLEQLARTHKVDLVLEGNVDEDRLLQLYNQARITVYAAIREPFGLVPVESMACGTPVVAVRDGGVQETVLDGQTGYLVQRDPEEFAYAVQHLLSTPDLANEFGKNGIEHVRQNWTWENAISTLEEQFKKANQDTNVH
jgi:glycosyltransferase involved in cell wall biosynthesis